MADVGGYYWRQDLDRVNSSAKEISTELETLIEILETKNIPYARSMEAIANRMTRQLNKQLRALDNLKDFSDKVYRR